MRITGNYKHGGRGTRLYQIWKSMRERCYNPNTNRAKNYHDRGIRICSEWDNFAVFREWAINNGYDDSLSIDRIDTNKGYSPSNCRWASIKEQARNKTTTVYYSYKGENRCLADLAEEYGVPYKTLYARVKYRGWGLDRALLTRIGGKT